MNVDQSSHAFILGCERSGSTWLSNVLDAHPDVEFFMEPFADYAGLFPGFPSRNLYLDHGCETLADIVSRGCDDLQRIKYLLFYKRTRSVSWKRVDRAVTRLLSDTGRWKTFNTPVRVKQCELLNLNLADVPIAWQVRKSRVPVVTILKELRLNFKVGLLQRVFPQSKYIIVVRHPGAQITSIMRLFRKGHLGELRRSLHALYAYLRESDRFDKYATYYKCLDDVDNVREMLLLWWLINYEVAIEECKRYKVDYRIAYNEKLSEAPEDTFREVFSFLELEYAQNVNDYVARSTQVSGDRRSTSDISPVNTVRDSSKHSVDSIASIDDEMRLSISNLFEHFDVIDELERYREIL